MSTIDFDEFRKRKPNVDVDSVMLQYDIVKALPLIRCKTGLLLEKYFPTQGHDFLCSTAVRDLRVEIARIQALWSEISNKTLLVANRLERADKESLEMGLQHRLTPVDDEIARETQNEKRRAEKLKKMANRRSQVSE